MEKQQKIAIIGLGYVGLPLAVAFAQKYQVVGFDINEDRINALKNGIDSTLEIGEDYLKNTLIASNSNLNDGANGLWCTNEINDIANCTTYIVTVPTPTDKNNRPDLTPLIKASETVGKVLKKGDIVIYESTVYPGVTEDECVPILANTSGLVFNTDFFAGYSPERINPGDKEHTITKILKVTSGSTPEIAIVVDNLYNSIITAGTFKASCIKVAEAAKVIENSQRDINIAFVNELAKIFNLIGIDTHEVLAAAGTKWNFLPFKPGLVGGHCIGVDPYYLAQKAQEMGYHPEIILAGRRLNDGMGAFIAKQVVKRMILKDIRLKTAKVLLMGFTFKENCPDTRNTRVIDIYRELTAIGLQVDIYDPWANIAEVKHEYGINILNNQDQLINCYEGVVLAVAHDLFKSINIKNLQKENAVLYDVKGVLPLDTVDERL